MSINSTFEYRCPPPPETTLSNWESEWGSLNGKKNMIDNDLKSNETYLLHYSKIESVFFWVQYTRKTFYQLVFEHYCIQNTLPYKYFKTPFPINISLQILTLSHHSLFRRIFQSICNA